LLTYAMTIDCKPVGVVGDGGFPDVSVETPGGNVVPVTAGVDPVIAVPVVAGGPVDGTDGLMPAKCEIIVAIQCTGKRNRLD